MQKRTGVVGGTGRALKVLMVLAAAAGCAGSPEDDSGASDDHLESARNGVLTLDVKDVNLAIAKLDEQRTKAPIAPFQDATRIEGCWTNPAANRPCKAGETCAPWTDLKRAFYCKQPLEFRICSSTVLLNTETADTNKRMQGYADCQKKVDALFGDKGLFIYDEQVTAVWKAIIVDSETLPPGDAASVIAANKPVITGRSFPLLLAEIVHGVAAEARDLTLGAAFGSMVDDLKRAGGEDLEEPAAEEPAVTP
jgi:hypothetical protein